MSNKTEITEIGDSGYILTRYGEEKLETLPTFLSSNDFKSSKYQTWNKRLLILDRVRAGLIPYKALDFLPEGKQKTRGENSLKKELAKMVRANLVKKVE